MTKLYQILVPCGRLMQRSHHLDLAALYRFKQVREDFREKRWGAMTCVIVPDPAGGSLVEMFEEIAIKGSAHSRVVFDMNSAELWCAGS